MVVALHKRECTQLFLIDAAVVAMLFVGLSIRTLRLRCKLFITLGDAGNATLLREIQRIQILPSRSLPDFAGNGAAARRIGTTPFIGRICHAIEDTRVNENLRFRVSGMVLTLSIMAAAAWCR